MTWDTAQQFLRITLQFAGGMLVSKGVLTEEMAATAVGALISLGGVAWWAFWNKKRA